MAKKEYEQLTEELITPIIEANHFELVDVEWVKEGSSYYLRVYADKPGGITVDDCELISRAFGDILDEKDYIQENYIFEVSSPGLDRPLRKDKDFARSIGKEVEIRLYKSREGRREFEGVLTAWDKDTVTIRTEEEEELVFERPAVSLIRLAFRF